MIVTVVRAEPLYTIELTESEAIALMDVVGTLSVTKIQKLMKEDGGDALTAPSKAFGVTDRLYNAIYDEVNHVD